MTGLGEASATSVSNELQVGLVARTGGCAPCRGGGGDAERGGAQGRGLGVEWGAQMVLRPLLSLQHTLRDDQCAYGHFS